MWITMMICCRGRPAPVDAAAGAERLVLLACCCPVAGCRLLGGEEACVGDNVSIAIANFLFFECPVHPYLFLSNTVYNTSTDTWHTM
jgi:hypothetical protein